MAYWMFNPCSPCCSGTTYVCNPMPEGNLHISLSYFSGLYFANNGYDFGYLGYIGIELQKNTDDYIWSGSTTIPFKTSNCYNNNTNLSFLISGVANSNKLFIDMDGCYYSNTNSIDGIAGYIPSDLYYGTGYGYTPNCKQNFWLCCPLRVQNYIEAFMGQYDDDYLGWYGATHPIEVLGSISINPNNNPICSAQFSCCPYSIGPSSINLEYNLQYETSGATNYLGIRMTGIETLNWDESKLIWSATGTYYYDYYHPGYILLSGIPVIMPVRSGFFNEITINPYYHYNESAQIDKALHHVTFNKRNTSVISYNEYLSGVTDYLSLHGFYYNKENVPDLIFSQGIPVKPHYPFGYDYDYPKCSPMIDYGWFASVSYKYYNNVGNITQTAYRVSGYWIITE